MRDAMTNTAAHRGNGPGWFTAFVTIALIGACVMIVLQVRQNRRLQNELEAATKALVEEKTKGQLAVGTSLTPLELVGADGRKRLLDFAGSKWTLLFLVGGHCPYCEETVPVWDKVMTRTQAVGNPTLSIVTIQLDAKAPEELKGLTPALTPELASERRTWLAEVPIVPAALLVSPKGVVRRAWFGIPSTQDERELEKTMLGVGLEE